MNERNLTIEYVPIETLKEYERNAKEHPEAHIKQIAASITEFGFNDPIGIDSDNTIIEGHGRLFAARKLKLKEVPIIRIGHLTDDQKKAYIIAHNRLGQLTGFNLEMLFSELESLDGDLQELTGFNDEEISDIFNQLDKDIQEKKIKEDEEWEYISEQDDIWILDNHRIICGNSEELNTFDKLLKNKKIDLILTDQPYNINYIGFYSADYVRLRKTIENDKLDKEDFSKFLEKVYTNLNIYLKDGGVFYIFYDIKDPSSIEEINKIKELDHRQTLIWVKDRHTFGRSDYQNRHEAILYGWKLGDKRFFTFDRTQTSVLDELHNKNIEKLPKEDLLKIIKELKKEANDSVIYEDRKHATPLHPTMKPVNLMKRFIKNSSKLGDLVLDAFLGSGSTLIAADETRRICYGIEINPKYIDTTVARYIKHKRDNNQEYVVKLIRNNKEIDYTDTGIEEVIDLI